MTNMNFEAIVGLELHVQMKTKSKMFSSAPVKHGDKPNTNVTPFDMAFPGTMPIVNKQAVINAIRVCHALHMNIDDELWFDRKNYFYSDLPKGYQITQQRRPIGTNGYIEINNKQIGIERLHLEEDACKQIHSSNYTFVDFNRAGVPLMEIVFKPANINGEEAMRYVEKIRSIVSFLGVSDGRMEEGSLRCDVNVSIRPIGQKTFGTKVEIKNINTLLNIKKAVDYEIKRQETTLLSGARVKQETKRFDEIKKQTIPMRTKSDDVDYKYFTDPNIPPIKLSKEFIDSAIKTSPELAEQKVLRYKKLGLKDYDCNLLVANKDICDYFDNVIKEGVNAKLAANWVLVEVQFVLNKKNISISDFSVSPKRLAELIKLIENEIVYNKQAREIFSRMLASDKTANDLLKELNISMTKDDGLVITAVKDILDENPQSISDYKNGKDKVVGYLVGQVIKKTNGQANPSKINELVLKELKVR